MSNFNFQRMNQGEVQILSFSGYRDNDASRRVDRELVQLLEQKHRRVIFDLAQLSSATRMSLARLLVCGREFRRHGRELKLVGWSTSLRHMADLEGFDRQKDFAPDVATGLTAMSRLPEVEANRPLEKK